MCNREGLLRIGELCRKKDNFDEFLSLSRHCSYTRPLRSWNDCKYVARHLKYLEDPPLEAYFSSEKYQGKRFPQTQRPYNEMLTSYLGNYCESGFYLPVVRYQTPTGLGIYYNDTTQPGRAYCGRFFFYEPDSCTYLHLGRYLVTANKIDAFLTLWDGGGRDILLREMEPFNRYQEKWEKDYSDKTNIFLNHRRPFMPYANGREPQTDEDFFTLYSGTPIPDYERKYKAFARRILHEADLHQPQPYEGAIDSLMDPDEVTDKMSVLLPGSAIAPDEDWDYMTVPVNVLLEDHYGTYYGSIIVGNFDTLDQPICVMARGLGYDTVLLQREPGEYRIVTEILDTRLESRLCRDVPCQTFSQGSSYPTIWTPETGFLEK